MSDPIRLLLVEDNPGDADLLLYILESSQLTFHTTVVIDGEAALDYLLEAKRAATPLPQLIVLDLNLPKLSGREVLEALQRDEHLRRIPVVILTSSDAENDINMCQQLGAGCYLTKPMEIAGFQPLRKRIEEFWLAL